MALVGCGSTHQALLKLQHADLTTRTTNCQQVIDALKQQPDPDRGADISVFVPKAVLDSVLAGAAARYPLPTVKADLVVNALTVDGSCGSPVVNVDATAVRGSLSVSMKASIVLTLTIDPKDPAHALVRVVLNDIKPDVKWGPFDFALRGFVRELLLLKLSEYAAALPALTIPLQSQSPYNFPSSNTSVTFPVPSGSITGALRTPGLAGTLTLNLTRTFFLQDGWHVYFTTAF